MTSLSSAIDHPPALAVEHLDIEVDAGDPEASKAFPCLQLPSTVAISEDSFQA